LQYEAYRKNFKHILEGEKHVDKMRKQVEANQSKLNKINKQVYARFSFIVHCTVCIAQLLLISVIDCRIPKKVRDS
jgi:hypothetical protein